MITHELRVPVRFAGKLQKARICNLTLSMTHSTVTHQQRIFESNLRLHEVLNLNFRGVGLDILRRSPEFFPQLLLHLHRDVHDGGLLVIFFKNTPGVTNFLDMMSATRRLMKESEISLTAIKPTTFTLRHDRHWVCEVVLAIEEHVVGNESKCSSI